MKIIRIAEYPSVFEQKEIPISEKSKFSIDKEENPAGLLSLQSKPFKTFYAWLTPLDFRKVAKYRPWGAKESIHYLQNLVEKGGKIVPSLKNNP